MDLGGNFSGIGAVSKTTLPVITSTQDYLIEALLHEARCLQSVEALGKDEYYGAYWGMIEKLEQDVLKFPVSVSRYDGKKRGKWKRGKGLDSMMQK